jgi:hypothetical protein
MASIITGVFPTREQAELALRELRDRGINAADVGFAWRSPAMTAAAGAPTGNAPFGWVPDHRHLALTGIGSAVVGGLIAQGLNEGSAAGTNEPSLADALNGLGIPRDHAEWYNQMVGQGYQLVLVRTESRGREIAGIMRQHDSLAVPSAGRTPGVPPEPPIPVPTQSAQTTPTPAAPPPASSQATAAPGPGAIRPGWEVEGSNGGHIGKIDEIGPDYLLVRQGTIFHHDLFIPFSAIQAIQPNRVVLDVSRDQVGQQGWQQPPPAAATGTAPASNQTDELAQVQQGYDVYSQDGELLGTVQEAAPNCLKVLVCSYMFVSPDRVERIDHDRVVLNVTVDRLEDYDWDNCQPSPGQIYPPGGPGESGLPPQEHTGGVPILIEPAAPNQRTE